MYLIGLTGGIAAGKSVVSRRLAEHGAVHIDADKLAREVVEPGTPGLAAIEKSFGPSVVADDGTLNRAALGAIIFADAEKRVELNEITHPAIIRRGKEIMAAATAADPNVVIVYDVPLLVEGSPSALGNYDLIVVVNADVETRIRRMIDLRGMTREEAMHRINSQASDAERLAIADVVIESSGTLEETLRQADELWAMAAASAVSKTPE